MPEDPLALLDAIGRSALPACPTFSARGITQAACRVHGALALRISDGQDLREGIQSLLDDPARFYEQLAALPEIARPVESIKELKLNAATLLNRYSSETSVLRYEDAPPLASVTLFTDSEGLAEAAVVITTVESDWVLPAHLEHRVQPVVAKARQGNKRVYNNKNARLDAWRFDSHTRTLHLYLRPTWYYYHLATNVHVDSQIGSEKQPLRDRVARDGKLEPLDSSILSNELGLNALLVTRDDFLVLPQRSDAVLGTENLVGPSVSGAVAWYHRDAHGVCPFQALRTQLADELGLFEPDIADVRLVGLSRGLLWGGHPSVRFIVQTHLTYPEVMERFAQGTRDNWEARGPRSFTMLRASDIKGLESVIRNPNAAAPLRAMLIHYIAYRRAQPEP
jgi:hypothetical protein